MLHVHRADRADALVRELAGVLAVPPADPFARELVAVHSRGFERWLAQQLALRLGAGADRHDGVCANVEFPFPGRIVATTMEAAGQLPPRGADGRSRDPWEPTRLTWAVLEELDRSPGAYGTLSAHLAAGGTSPAARRYAAARHVADLFDRYGVHRPEMLRRWAQDDDVDAAGDPLPRALDWQPGLWRRLASQLGVPGPAARLGATLTWLRSGSGLVGDLPQRFSLFGLTALPASYVEVLTALADRHDVHLFLLHPSPGLWDRCAPVLAEVTQDRPRRRDDPTRLLAEHPLLRTWGRDTREMQVLVHAAGAGAHAALASSAGDLDASHTGTTLLARLQADVRADRAPSGAPTGDDEETRPQLSPDDRSVQVHSCHGRTRQVQVLRDAILHLLAEDPSLEPRDIVVMCPDIEEFAPLIESVFGISDVPVASAPDDGTTARDDGRPPPLRVRLADRSLRAANPVLEVTARLLELADARLTASEVLDLAARGPVRRRFRFDDDDLETLGTWVSGLGVRWGLDAAHREPFGVGDVELGTWEHGLRRLAVGLAVADRDLRLVAGVAPFDDVEGKQADLAGRLAEFVSRLRVAVASLDVTQDAGAWRDAIATAVDLLADPGEDTWQRAALGSVLEDLVAEASTPTGEPRPVGISLPELRSLLLDRLRGRPSRANQRTGDLTVCTLVPMRSVPHRVVCLLGMDDDAFPRRTTPDGDDLLEQDPRVGDRDVRTEDRQLLLDAVLAATDHLVILFTGNDERTNAPEPPAVPIGELLDVLDRTARAPDGGAARTHVVTTHPLQPFDSRNFTIGGLHPSRPWSFDVDDLGGARARARGGGAGRYAPILEPLLPLALTSLEIDELVAAWVDPATAFLRRRLGARLSRSDDPVEDALPLFVPGLVGFAIGDRVLAAAMTGGDIDRALDLELARGTTPPGAIGRAALAEVRGPVEALLAKRAQHVPAVPETGIDLDLSVRPDGDGAPVRLTGRVSGVHDTTIAWMTYAGMKHAHRLGAWLRLCAVAAQHPNRDWRAVVIAKSKRNDPTEVWVLDAPSDPVAELAWFVARALDGLRWPLPFAPATSAAWAKALPDLGEATVAATKKWGPDPFGYPEGDSDANAVLYGVGCELAVLLEAPDLDDRRDGCPASDAPHRFGRIAERAYATLDTHAVEVRR
ncbi:MAG: exodeoxyribonuclease V subunit gamma [Actinomycetes bacterium]